MIDAPVNQVADVRDLRDVLVDAGVQAAEDGDVEPVGVETVAFGDGRDLAGPGLPAVDDGGRPVDPQLGPGLKRRRDRLLIEVIKVLMGDQDRPSAGR